MLIALLLTAPIALAQNALWDPGATIVDAASVQVTQRGLDRMGDMVPLVFPSQIDVDDQTDLPVCDSITGMWVGIGVDDVRITPTTNRIDLEVDMQVWINNAADPFAFDCGIGCDLYVKPFPVSISMPATAAVVYDDELGHNVVDVTMGSIDFDQGLTEGHVEDVGFCAFTLITDLLDASGLSLIDFFWQVAEPILGLYIEIQVKPDLETQLEEALAAAYFSDAIEIGDAVLDIEVEPQVVQISSAGIDVRAQGWTNSTQGDCMVDRDPGGSLKTATAVPAITDNPASTEYAVLLSDDIANQGLYSVWRSGLFCFDLSESGDIEIPFPLNTSLLGLIGGEGFSELFPESKPMDIFTSPDAAPRVTYEGTHDLVAEVRELGIDFYTEVDYRQARALGVDLEVDVPVDLDFDGTDGELTVLVTLDSQQVAVIPSHNELVAGSDETIQSNFGSILDVVLDQFLGGQLDDLSFLVPSIETDGGDRIGLLTLVANSAGAENDWLRVRAGLGTVQYDNTDAENGCGEGGGCNSAGGVAAGWLVVLPLLWWRRRERRG